MASGVQTTYSQMEMSQVRGMRGEGRGGGGGGHQDHPFAPVLYRQAMSPFHLTEMWH